MVVNPTKNSTISSWEHETMYISDEIETMLIVMLLILVVGFWVGVSYILRFPILLDYHGDDALFPNKGRTSAKFSSTDISRDRCQPLTTV